MRDLRLFNKPSLVISMMWPSDDNAKSSASWTRDEALGSSETTMLWIASKNETCADGIAERSPVSAPMRFSLLTSPKRCCRHICIDTVSALNQIIPQRETVAGVACSRLSTSRIILTFSGMFKRSPDGSVSSLLSSKTEFKFSAHSGSTSPSNTIQ